MASRIHLRENDTEFMPVKKPCISVPKEKFWPLYIKQFNASSGFDIDIRPPPRTFDGGNIVLPIERIHTDPKLLENIEALAVSGIETYNKESDVEFKVVSISKLNQGQLGGFSTMSYITFTAQEVNKIGEYDLAPVLTTFQALVEECYFPYEAVKVLFCRPKSQCSSSSGHA